MIIQIKYGENAWGFLMALGEGGAKEWVRFKEESDIIAA
jgi:hypothetical protein